MNFDVDGILSAVESKDYGVASEMCKEFISVCMTEFMEKLTVNTATDFVGGVLLYAQICGAVKKPWKCIPELDSVRGALRFMEDYMADKETLCEAYRSVADAYAYAGFLPEAILNFKKTAAYATEDSVLEEALYFAFFYEARFGRRADDGDLSIFEVRVKKDGIESLKRKAKRAAEEQIRLDPVENSEDFLKVRYEVEKRVDLFLSEKYDSSLPYCIQYWNEKERVLKENFGIDWRSPAAMNPDIRFY